MFHSAKRSSEFAIRTGQKTSLLDWLAVPHVSPQVEQERWWDVRECSLHSSGKVMKLMMQTDVLCSGSLYAACTVVPWWYACRCYTTA